MVKELVEAQLTLELQSQLFAIAESNLTTLTKIVKKESRVAKFDGNKEFIPVSIRLLPELDIYGDLGKTDNDTIQELAKWNETLTTCKKALASHIKNQSGRNILSMKAEHQKLVLHDTIGIGATMDHYFKKVHDLGLSITNMNVISKSAFLNFISSLK